MNKIYNIVNLLAIVALCGLAPGACKKTLEDQSYFKVYVNMTVNIDSTVNAGFILVGDSAYGNPNYKIAAVTTLVAPSAITSKFVIDTSLVAAYNGQNNTHYHTLPAGLFTLANSGQFTIKKDSVVSDSIAFTFTAPGQLTDSNGYLVPLVITDLNG